MGIRFNVPAIPAMTPDRVEDLGSVFSLLAVYCDGLARAKRARMEGLDYQSTSFQACADAIHNLLPEWARP